MPGLDLSAAYDEHIWTVYGFLAYRTGRREDAEDLTQAVFERAIKASGRYADGKGSVKTWLLSIARNLLIDHYRADRSAANAPLDEMGADEPAYEDAIGLGLSPDLATALAELPHRDREVVALRYGGDLSGPEIAAMTGLTVANVQQILSRSLRRMRERLEAPARSG